MWNCAEHRHASTTRAVAPCFFIVRSLSAKPRRAPAVVDAPARLPASAAWYCRRRDVALGARPIAAGVADRAGHDALRDALRHPRVLVGPARLGGYRSASSSAAIKRWPRTPPRSAASGAARPCRSSRTSGARSARHLARLDDGRRQVLRSAALDQRGERYARGRGRRRTGGRGARRRSRRGRRSPSPPWRDDPPARSTAPTSPIASDDPDASEPACRVERRRPTHANDGRGFCRDQPRRLTGTAPAMRVAIRAARIISGIWASVTNRENSLRRRAERGGRHPAGRCVSYPAASREPLKRHVAAFVVVISSVGIVRPTMYRSSTCQKADARSKSKRRARAM